MDQTIPGGCYLLNGKYVDANGEPVSAEGVAAYEELQVANAQRIAAIEDQLRQANLTPAQALAQILQAPPVLPVETKATEAQQPEQPETPEVKQPETTTTTAKAKK